MVDDVTTGSTGQREREIRKKPVRGAGPVVGWLGLVLGLLLGWCAFFF